MSSVSSMINPGSFGMGFPRVDDLSKPANPPPPAEPSGGIPPARSPSGNPAVPKEALQRAIPSSPPTRPTPPKASDLSGTVGVSVQGLAFENGASAINTRISGGLSLKLDPRTTVGLSAFIEHQGVKGPDRTLVSVEGNLRRTFEINENVNVALTGSAGAEVLNDQVTPYGGGRVEVNYKISDELSGSAFASAQFRAPFEQPPSVRLEQGVGLSYRPDEKVSLSANVRVREGVSSEGVRLERVTGALQIDYRVNKEVTAFGRLEHVHSFTGPDSWGVTGGVSVKL